MSRTARPRVKAPGAGSPNHLPTSFLLMAQYGGRAVVPIEDVCRDFFAHLTPEKLLRKVGNGEIPLPVVKVDAASQKSAKGVHLSDLADFLDARRAVAKKELALIHGGRLASG